MKIFREVFKLGDQQVTIETGAIARQATGSVTVRIGDTVVLVTTVAKKEVKPGMSFFPLTINYLEKFYATGKIPGGFLRREGRPNDRETLIARLIDRPLRPLFPKGFLNEVQVVATVLSYDPEVPPDIPALIGASASLILSGVPFNGPAAGVRVGFKNGRYLLNPTTEQMKTSELDLIVAGTESAVLMVESEADCLPEEVMLGAVLFGHKSLQVIIKAIEHLASHAQKPKWEVVLPEGNTVLKKMIKADYGHLLAEAYQSYDKIDRNEKLKLVRGYIIEKLISDPADDQEYEAEEIQEIIFEIEKEMVRQSIVEGNPRIDGRDTRTVRPIQIKTGILPRVHGSALFTRGETQAIVATTLGGDRDSQIVETISSDSRERFMLHYNFPPYCVGETGMIGSPKRREIGHANLAKRALLHAFPETEDYDYVIRTVSEITESNGSSSMATVCGSSLSLMDAGVPMKAPVAGIAMGLIKEGDKFAVLSDILGDEDHLGDMDFKVAGTESGITALQMDIKIQGITSEIMKLALDQAKEGRIHILGLMNEVLDKPRTQLSEYVPQMETMQVKPAMIRDIIGKGGSTIKRISEESGSEIKVSDDGTVKILGANKAALAIAVSKIEDIIAVPETGKDYLSTVVKVMEYGAFVEVMPGKEALLHISEMGVERDTPSDKVFYEGQKLTVNILNIDRQGKLKLALSNKKN